MGPSAGGGSGGRCGGTRAAAATATAGSRGAVVRARSRGVLGVRLLLRAARLPATGAGAPAGATAARLVAVAVFAGVEVAGLVRSRRGRSRRSPRTGDPALGAGRDVEVGEEVRRRRVGLGRL